MKRILSVLIGGLMSASPVMAAGTYEDHVKLSEVISQTGITFRINPLECDEDPSFGWYHAKDKELVVCQENRVKGTTAQVQWTMEDLDTLRHEVHHLTQDCMDGSIDGNLGAVYVTPISWALDVLGSEKIHQILKNYSNRSSHIQTMELEAFAVAAVNNPLEQLNDVKKYCLN